MARIRTIKPEFFRHEALYEAERSCGFPLRLAFAGLWTAADREGRFRWQPRALKLDCLPYDDVDFGVVLDALCEAGFIVKYQSEEGGALCGYIPGWDKHQHINQREAQSSLPAPSGECTCTHVTAHGEGKGREGEGKEKDGGDVARAREPLISPEAFTLADGLIEAAGWDRDDPHTMGVPMTAQRWISGKWNPDLCIATVARLKAASRKKISTLAYFERAIAEAHAEQSAPLPVVVIDPTQKVIHAQANQRHPAGAYGASKDRFREAYAELGAIAAEPVDRPGGPQVAEFLPAAGRK